jgi:hypothetical protein
MKQKVLKNVWLRVAMLVAVVTTAFAGTAQAQTETITVLMDEFFEESGYVADDLNISFEADGTASNGQISVAQNATLTLTANNAATINSVTIGSSSYCKLSCAGSEKEINNTQQSWGNLNSSSVVFTCTSKNRPLSLNYLSVTYTPAPASDDYTVTAATNHSDWGTAVANGNVIIATPETGFGFAAQAYTVSPEGAATVVQNGYKLFVSEVTADCTVTVNFAPRDGDVAIDFETLKSDLNAAYPDWTFSSVSKKAEGSNHYGMMNGGASIETVSLISFPHSISCNVKKEKGNGKTITVQVQRDGEAWEDVETKPLNSSDWEDWTVMLNTYGNVKVRLYTSSGNVQVDNIDLKTESPVVAVEITSVGYGTLYYGDRNLEVPAGVTAYTYSYDGTSIAVSTTYGEGAVIPAGEAVVLQGSAGEHDFNVVAGSFTKDAANKLNGSDEEATTTGGDVFYALSTKGGANVGFYWMAEGGAAFTNGAHKAYLALPSSGVKGFAFGLEDDATAIETIVNGQQTTEGAIYNLAGQRINKMQKGINIVNGKKILK